MIMKVSVSAYTLILPLQHHHKTIIEGITTPRRLTALICRIFSIKEVLHELFKIYLQSDHGCPKMGRC
jgi:hypothetical protein